MGVCRPKLEDINLAPNLEELINVFGVSKDDVIISYGDKIYLPKEGMTHDLLIHELVHCERQGCNESQAKQWWITYMRDPEFRKIEEAHAYKAQYEYCKRVYKDKNRQIKILYSLAKDLSSVRYGNCVSEQEARALIS